MPILKSGFKRMRTSEQQRISNLNVKTNIKSVRTKLFAALDGKNKADGDKLYRQYCSLLDKSAKKGVITRNTANRRKARVAARLKAMA